MNSGGSSLIGGKMTETIGAVLDRIEIQEPNIRVSSNATALELLQTAYRNNDLPLSIRMRAAMAAIPYESARLQVTAVVSENSLAELLEQRLRRIAQMKNGSGTKLIEPPPKQIASPIEVKPPKPHINDRRYRRF